MSDSWPMIERCRHGQAPKVTITRPPCPCSRCRQPALPGLDLEQTATPLDLLRFILDAGRHAAHLREHPAEPVVDPALAVLLEAKGMLGRPETLHVRVLGAVLQEAIEQVELIQERKRPGRKTAAERAEKAQETLIGFARDDLAILQSAIDYLRRH